MKKIRRKRHIMSRIMALILMLGLILPGAASVVAAETNVVEAVMRFDANGGSGKMESYTVASMDSVALPENDFVEPHGKIFKAWEFEGQEYVPGAEVTIVGDTVVKAIWGDAKEIRSELNARTDAFAAGIKDEKLNNVLRSTPVVTISEPLTVKRSEIVSRSFMDYDKWNLNEAWAAYSDYSIWEKTGIVGMLSKIAIDGQSIEPKNGDDWAYTQLYEAMNGGTTSFINKLSKVAVLSQKVRAVPVCLPVSAYEQLIAENQYIAPYEFRTDYSIDYSSYTPLFKNDFILIDDYRQFTFVFSASNDGQTHGKFTGAIIKLSLGSYENVQVPNNVVGLIQGQSMGEAGVGIPDYELDDGWEIAKITDNAGNVYTEAELLGHRIQHNEVFTIHLKQPVKPVVVPSIWYAVDKDTGELISGLHPIHTVPELYPRRELAVFNDETGIYDINLAAIPEPLSPGTWSENNFNLTASILFADRFHRVAGQGYNTFDIKPVSSVVKIKYGNYEKTDVANGIQGVVRTPYKEGETMHMYLAVREGTLSEALYKPGEVTTTNKLTDQEIRQTLLNHVDAVTYYDFDAKSMKNLDLTALDKLFLFKYSTNNDGNFIQDGAGYKNFMEASFSDLPDGRYEAVFPIYWGEDVSADFGAANEYIRNRYKLDDTFHFTFTKKSIFDINVSKVWADGNNQDGKRPDAVVVKLLADGVDTNKTLTLTQNNNWNGAFMDLDEYKAGQKIVYTVKEEEVGNGYTSTITGDAETGIVVTNTRMPEKTVVEGEKTWNDNNNQSGKRPVKITIHLLKNGVKTDTRIVTEADGWKWIFENLEKCEAGKLIAYTIMEDAVAGYRSEVSGYNVTNSYITDKPTKFESPTEPAKPTGSAPLPKTGDNSGSYLWLGMMCISASVVLLLFKRKIKTQND